MKKPILVNEIFINASTDLVWNAIVDGDMTAQYFYGTRVASTWEPGSSVVYANPDGTKASDGQVIAIDIGGRLEMTFRPLWDPELTAEGAAREIWTVEASGAATKLSVETHDIPEGGAIHTDFAAGFPYILSNLKTLLETGQSMQAIGPDGA